MSARVRARLVDTRNCKSLALAYVDGPTIVILGSGSIAGGIHASASLADPLVYGLDDPRSLGKAISFFRLPEHGVGMGEPSEHHSRLHWYDFILSAPG